eukprot:1300504-Pleurochrysis_carterae.AAC.1
MLFFVVKCNANDACVRRYAGGSGTNTRPKSARPDVIARAHGNQIVNLLFRCNEDFNVAFPSKDKVVPSTLLFDFVVFDSMAQ